MRNNLDESLAEAKSFVTQEAPKLLRELPGFYKQEAKEVYQYQCEKVIPHTKVSITSVKKISSPEFKRPKLTN